MKFIATLAAATIVSATAVVSAQAQVAYTNSALNGCYAHQSSAIATSTGSGNSNLVGTLCFDGNGKIMGSSGTPGLSGHVSNVGGTTSSVKNQTGTYSVTNSPGDGMGTFQGKCATHEFVLKNVDSNGLAHGFSYILLKTTKGCTVDALVSGGGAEYQGPLK